MANPLSTENVKERAQERSSWFGLGLITAGLGTLFKDDHMPQIGQMVMDNADGLAQSASSGDFTLPVSLILGGLVAIFKKGGK